MHASEIIRQKRDGLPLEREEVDFFVSGVTTGTIPDYQAAAFLMAVVLRGMSADETTWLTDAMVRSGSKVDLSDLPGSKVDKHSTGGVGDKTSLVLAPLAAACGAIVPMMSGRALGHTGGTLDKLEAIPGFRTGLSLEEFRAALADVGCCLIGQTAQIAPADKKLYALRDVTATVESVPLITASIMSKKIAEGIDGLVLDVKTGSGAFMKTEQDARALAESLVRTGNDAGVRTTALITAMDAPLGSAVGNSLEVIEAIETLKGRGPKDLETLSVLLAARMLQAAGLAATTEAAEQQIRKALASGAGVEKFRQIIERQGGDPRVVDDQRILPRAAGRQMIRAPRSGYLWRLDAELVGRATIALGAGRERVDDSIDPGVGAIVQRARGAQLAAGEPIIELHYGRGGDLARAVALAERAIGIGDQAPPAQSLVLAEIG